MDYLWAGMMIAGIVYGAFAGTLPEITTAVIDSAKEAIMLCITMLGVMSFWMGMMEIATQAGIIESMSHRMRPVMHFLFPRVPPQSAAYRFITTNVLANVLGLGWAATPAGLKAMEGLRELNHGSHGDGSCGTRKMSQRDGPCGTENTATDEMCTFLVINISSLQLIPMNIIAYRSQYGSVDPAAVIGPGIVATLCSTLAAVVFCKVMCGRRR
ncbi:MAG: nucleoside recognition protein [Hespellia sp.]|nr:nucleoside recognition protein [Hespellia sp.]